MAQKLAELQEIDNTKDPTPGKGLALNERGVIPESAVKELRYTRGDNVSHASTLKPKFESLHWSLRAGTASDPVRTVGPLLKVCKTESMPLSEMTNGQSNEENAAITAMVVADADTEVQAVAGWFVARTSADGTGPVGFNDDCIGVTGVAEVRDSGTGIAIGSYSASARRTDTGRCTGIEIQVQNKTDTDGVYSGTGFAGTVGLLVTVNPQSGSHTATISACGIQFNTANSGQWAVGIGFPKIGGVNTVKDAIMSVDCDATKVIDANGTHASVIDARDATVTDAILLGSGSGHHIRFGDNGILIVHGTGTPESAVTAPVGSIFLRSDGGAGTSFYVKESGTGNTGWVAK